MSVTGIGRFLAVAILVVIFSGIIVVWNAGTACENCVHVISYRLLWLFGQNRPSANPPLQNFPIPGAALSGTLLPDELSPIDAPMSLVLPS